MLNPIWVTVAPTRTQQMPFIVGPYNAAPQFLTGARQHTVWVPAGLGRLWITTAAGVRFDCEYPATHEGVVPLKVPAPPHEWVSGRVVDEHGNGIAGVRIGVPPQCRGWSDQEGKFQLRVEPRAPENLPHEPLPYQATLWHPQYQARAVCLDANAKRKTLPTFSMHRGRSITLALQDESGAPLNLASDPFRVSLGASLHVHVPGVVPIGFRAKLHKIGHHTYQSDPLPLSVRMASLRLPGSGYRSRLLCWEVQEAKDPLASVELGAVTLLRDAPVPPPDPRANGAVRLLLRTAEGQPARWGSAHVVESRADGRRGPGAYYELRGDLTVSGIETETPFILRVTAPGQQPLLLEQGPLAKGETRDLGVIQLPAGQPISGTVRDDRGKPVANVFVSNQVARNQWRTHTNRDGFFVLPHQAAGQHWLELRRRGMKTLQRRVTVRAEHPPPPLEFVMPRIARRSLRLKFPDGRPVTDALIEIVSHSDGDTLELQPDGRGYVGVPPLPDGPVDLTVRCGWRPDQKVSCATPEEIPRTITVTPGARVLVTLTLPDGIQMPHHLVMGRATQRPGFSWGISSARRYGDTYPLDDFYRVARADVDELVTIYVHNCDLPPGQHLQLTDQTQHLHFVIRPLHTPYSIRVRDADGEPVVGARVELIRHFVGETEGLTDERGRYDAVSFDSIDDIHIYAPGKPMFEWKPPDDRYDLPSFEPTNVEVQLPRSCPVELQLLDHVGTPVAGAKLSVSAPYHGRSYGPGHGAYRGVTDADGRLQTAPLVLGELKVHVEVDDKSVASLTAQGNCGGETIVLRVPPPRTVTGLVSIDGAIKDSGSVSIIFDERRKPRSSTKVKNGSGRFTLVTHATGPAVVEYREEIPSKRVFRRRVLVRDSETTVDATFSTHSIRGVAVDADAVPIAGLALRTRGSTWRELETDTDGRFFLEGLPDGELIVSGALETPLPGHFMTPRRVILGSADTRGPTELRLQLERTLPVHFRATEPVAELSASLEEVFCSLELTQREDGLYTVQLPLGDHELRFFGKSPEPHPRYRVYKTCGLSVQVPYDGDPISLNFETRKQRYLP